MNDGTGGCGFLLRWIILRFVSNSLSSSSRSFCLKIEKVFFFICIKIVRLTLDRWFSRCRDANCAAGTSRRVSGSAPGDTRKANRREVGIANSAAPPGRIPREKRLPRGTRRSRRWRTAASAAPTPESSRRVARRICSGSSCAQTTSDTTADRTADRTDSWK